MAPITGVAAYKKKDGTLTISNDQKSIVWLPHGSDKGVTILVANITNLQQTPETAAKVMLKIFDKPPDSAEAITHTFLFNSPSNPRAEANAIKESLTTLIAALKANDVSLPKANGTSGSSSMAMASAVTSKPSGPAAWYDDAQLKVDYQLQESLLKKDMVLNRTYMESRRTKPDSITDSQFNRQFWSTRVNLLRAFAVDSSQKKGPYNVLSAVKPRQIDGELKLNISAEQVQLIFSQHPLVRRVYDENVPKLREADFWSRFFVSRLFKKLKGERVTEADATDPTFDRYLDISTDDGLDRRLLSMHIPNIIDLEGNEENQGGSRSGNRKDFTMRPGAMNKVPIIRTLNSLSEKIMAQVAPSDVDPSAPIGMDEATYNSLALRDLQGDPEENRIMLNIKEQSRFFSSEKSELSAEAKLYAKQDPRILLLDLRKDLDPKQLDHDNAGGLDLRSAIGVNEDSDSDDEMKIGHVGSKDSIADAQRHVFEGIAARRVELEGTSAQSLSGLSQHIFDRLVLTHATTTEFLHHFWLVFLSGDADKANELAQLVASLERAMDRINAVAADAESEREVAIQARRDHIRQVYERSKKKLNLKSELIGGGKKVVLEMMDPTLKTLDKASREYRKALAAEGINTS
ncbi:related to RNA polymerase II transcription factor [Rhynchosporium secalis]|uniref:Related to RNA polymerase II transcription factor n=1 Tax=Rhynchosporium secalis TaxID=38038 RepID=A0A1E1MAF6_RHYSE|nr:related to RNA polymerase II transcription factor [Rhynchosporium secalis]